MDCISCLPLGWRLFLPLTCKTRRVWFEQPSNHITSYRINHCSSTDSLTRIQSAQSRCFINGCKLSHDFRFLERRIRARMALIMWTRRQFCVIYCGISPASVRFTALFRRKFAVRSILSAKQNSSTGGNQTNLESIEHRPLELYALTSRRCH